MEADFRVYLITDRKQAPGGDILRAVEGALEGGIRAVQLREKDLPGGELFRLAAKVRDLTAKHGARMLVNDRADVALAAGADGVHLGVSSLPPSAARKLLGGGALIGCSAHSVRELAEAAAQGADFATFGPVFATPSKAAYGPPVGLEALREACRGSSIPVFALGGIGAGNAADAIGAGAWGIALISGVVAAADPRAAALGLVAAVADARGGTGADRKPAKEGGS